MSKHLPVRANLERLKAQAKDLQRDARRGEPKARARVAHVLPDAALRDKLLEASDVELRLRQVLQLFDGLRLLGASVRFDFR